MKSSLALAFVLFAGLTAAAAGSKDAVPDDLDAGAAKSLIREARAKPAAVKAPGEAPALYRCPAEPPASLLPQPADRWRLDGHPELKDDNGNRVNAALFSRGSGASKTSLWFLCLGGRWLRGAEAPNAEKTLPALVRLSGDLRHAYFSYLDGEYDGLRLADLPKTQDGSIISSTCWFRANPSHANFLAVDFPPGSDHAEPLVSEALRALDRANLLGETAFKDKALREGVAALAAAKLAPLAKTMDLHVALYRSLLEGSPDIGRVSSGAKDGWLNIPLTINAARGASPAKKP